MGLEERACVVAFNCWSNVKLPQIKQLKREQGCELIARDYIRLYQSALKAVVLKYFLLLIIRSSLFFLCVVHWTSGKPDAAC